MPRNAYPLPDKIRRQLEDRADDVEAARRDLEDLEQKRDRVIVRARKAGAALRPIADAAGVSHQHVANLAAEADQ